MRNLIFSAAIMLVLAGCASINVEGLYHSSDCGDDSENCFQYNFHDDGNFAYWYTNQVFGDFLVSGNYYLIGKKLKLFPVKYIYHDTTRVVCRPRHNPDSSTINISLLPGYLINKPDTMHVPWLIRVNDAPFFDETDEYGAYQLPATDIRKIEVKEYSAKFYMDSELPEADTTIYPAFPDRDINIMLASSVLEPMVIPPVTRFKVKQKGRMLESLDTMDVGYWQHTTRLYVR